MSIKVVRGGLNRRRLGLPRHGTLIRLNENIAVEDKFTVGIREATIAGGRAQADASPSRLERGCPPVGASIDYAPTLAGK